MIEIKHRDELDYIEVNNQSAQAKIALQGAHIFDYKRAGEEAVLWLSETSSFKKGKAIRGGIPICWPWFGAHKEQASLPNHGFARTSLWKHVDTKELSEDETHVRLQLNSSLESLKLWPYDFELYFDVYIGSELRLILTTVNVDNRAFEITQALHSYFTVTDINQVFIEGLKEKVYYDKLDGGLEHLQQERLHFSQEIDRIYSDVENDILLRDKEQTVYIKTSGNCDIVVWNPWKTLTSKMPDMSDYKDMLCIESAQVLSPVKVKQGSSVTIQTTISKRLNS